MACASYEPNVPSRYACSIPLDEAATSGHPDSFSVERSCSRSFRRGDNDERCRLHAAGRTCALGADVPDGRVDQVMMLRNQGRPVRRPAHTGLGEHDHDVILSAFTRARTL